LRVRSVVGVDGLIHARFAKAITIIKLVGSFFTRLAERTTEASKALLMKSSTGLAIRAVHVGWKHKLCKFVNFFIDVWDKIFTTWDFAEWFIFVFCIMLFICLHTR